MRALLLAALVLLGCASRPKPVPAYCPESKTIWECLGGGNS